MKRAGGRTIDAAASATGPQRSWLSRAIAAAQDTAPVIGWSAAALSVTFGLLGLALMTANRANPRIPDDPFWGAAFVVAVVFPAVGALIVSRLPSNPLGWLLCLIGFSGGLGWFADHYSAFALLSEPGTLPGGLIVGWLSWTGELSFSLLLSFLILLFPDGRLPSRHWRPFAWFVAIGMAIHLLDIIFKPVPLSTLPWLDNPVGVGSGIVPWAVVDWVNGLPYIPLVLGCIASLAVRFLRARGDERQQIKWFAYAAALLPVSLALNAAFPGLAWAIGGVSVALLPSAIGVAILKYHLYDIDLLINRTIVYALLTTFIVGIYVLTVGYLGELFQTTGNLAISLVGAGLVAVLFQPLRGRLQRGVNRLLYGERHEPYAVLARLGQRLESTLAPEAVLPTVVETIAQALRLPYAAITLRRDGELTVAAAYGIATDECLHLPLVYRGEEVGDFVVAPRSPGESFSPADRRLLEDLSSHAGIAVHAVSLTAELRRSRERLVVAREEERRRLRRDLHDGLGPALAAHILRVGTARALLSSDPATAGRLLGELEDDLDETVSDVRRLVYNLRPPALDDLGLIGAIRASAAQYAANEPNGLRIDVEVVEPLPPLPAAVEVAAYRISQEALTNVVRHAQARSCQLGLVVEEPERGKELVLTVVDDGLGIAMDSRAGVGMTSMRERAEELGGTCEVRRRPEGGTHVVARLPVSRSLPESNAQTQAPDNPIFDDSSLLTSDIGEALL